MVDAETATAIVQEHLDPALSVTQVRPLTGGMINTVVEFVTDGDPASVVAKLSKEKGGGGFQGEYNSLRYFSESTSFPVPHPYVAFAEGVSFDGKGILMEKMPGRHLGEARLTRKGMEHYQHELARILADLHDHRRDSYGSAAGDPGYDLWVTEVRRRMTRVFGEMRHRISSEARSIVERLLPELEHWLPEFNEPTLTHGDIWGGNVMVDDADPDEPRISALIDGGAAFREVEDELAYLRVFHTADETFFRDYVQRHELREGFDRRCRVYWLHTMHVHLWLFGEQHYVDDVARTAAQIAKRL